MKFHERRFWEIRVLFLMCILFALLFLTIPAHGEGKTKVNEDGSVTVTVPAEEVAYCMKNGGCRLVSKNDFMNAIAQEIRKACGKPV